MNSTSLKVGVFHCSHFNFSKIATEINESAKNYVILLSAAAWKQNLEEIESTNFMESKRGLVPGKFIML